MELPLHLAKKNQKGVITTIDLDYIPNKIIEMGCLEGNNIEVLQLAPFGDPIYIKINETHLAIRKEMAQHITISILEA